MYNKSQISNFKSQKAPKASLRSRPVVNFGCDFAPTISRGCQNSTTGYAAMFSFLVMTIVLGGLMSVFAVLAFKTIFLARTSAIEFKNIYAAEGFAEDAIKRIRDSGLADPTDNETLGVGEATVTASLSSQGSVKTYSFSAQTGQKYFISEILTVDGSGPSAKIKKWQDTQ